MEYNLTCYTSQNPFTIQFNGTYDVSRHRKSGDSITKKRCQLEAFNFKRSFTVPSVDLYSTYAQGIKLYVNGEFVHDNYDETGRRSNMVHILYPVITALPIETSTNKVVIDVSYALEHDCIYWEMPVHLTNFEFLVTDMANKPLTLLTGETIYYKVSFVDDANV